MMQYIIFCLCVHAFFKLATQEPSSTTRPHESATYPLSQTNYEAICPFGIGMDFAERPEDGMLNRLFPGLFHNMSSSFEMLQPVVDPGIVIRAEKVKMKKSKKKEGKKKRSVNDACCQTVHDFVVPETVFYYGNFYNVSHGQNSYQILYTGKCRQEVNLQESTGPVCVTQRTYQWILVDDDTLPYEPKVKFIPILFESYCACLNLG